MIIELVQKLEIHLEQALSISRFFFPLHIYEVAIRNAISDAIRIRYGKGWPTNTVFQNSLNKLDKETLLLAIKNYQGVGKLLPEIKFVWFESMLTIRKFRDRCGHYEPVFGNAALPDINPLIVNHISIISTMGLA